MTDPGQVPDPVRSALAAAAELARAHGVRVHEPLVLADGADLVVHLRPAPLVAKVALSTHLVREPAAWQARELAVAAHLDRAGVPVVRASDLLPAVVHELDDQVLTSWNTCPTTRAQPWTWADLEDSCSGPPAWDLVCVDTSTRVDGAAALRAYGDVPDLTPWRELRRLHATAWTCLYAERLPRHRDGAAAMLAVWG